MNNSKLINTNILNNIKACIFDMDGTLIDSMSLWYDIDVAYFKKYNKILPDDYQTKIEGLSVIETAIFTKENYGFDISIDYMIDEWNQMAYEQYANRIEFKPFAKNFLISLKEKGYKLGVATSNSKYLFEAFSKKSGLDQLIDFAVTGEDVECGKPDPECYLKVASALNVKPEECLVFEDITQGLQAAINAGMKSCAVYDLYSVHQWDDKVKMSDCYINSYEDTKDLFLR